ncbi:hypothetical protein SAMN06265379_1221, partial [Saccharicrinis carchari]
MKYLLLSIFVLLSLMINAQTGPAGIGNSDGTNGQPHNILWLDASDLSTLGDGETWFDKSGNNHHALNTGASLTMGTLGGENAVDFSAFTSGNLQIANHGDFDNLDALEMFVVYNTGADANTPRGLVSKRTNTSAFSFVMFIYNQNQLNGDATGTRITQPGSVAPGNYIAHYKYKGGSLFELFSNGSSVASTTSGFYNPLSNVADAIEIGKMDENYSGANNFKGQIAEIIIYKTNLSPVCRALVVNYLSTKYGISVQETNLAYAPSNAAYYGDLTAYARTSSEFKDFGPSAGLYTTLNDAAIDDYISAAHNGALNDEDNIQTGSDVTVSGAVAAWNRNWYVQKGGASTAKISFSFPEAFVDGSFPQELSNYVLLRKSTAAGNYSEVSIVDKGVDSGERVWFEVADASFENGYYTLGTTNQTASPLEGGSTRTWYTLISGDWDNWEVWTLDPSGALPNNPNQFTPTTSPTGPSDKVVVLNGKTVTVSANDKIHEQIRVDGRLDLQATSGHNFGQIRGRGRILLSDNYFPAGDATHFTSAGQGEGTVVYYGSGFDLTQDLTFYNLEINLSTVSDKITLLSNLNIHGEFRIKKGDFQFNNGAATNPLTVTVNGEVIVEENGKLLTGTGNARHQFNLNGDFTNNGSVAFTNRTLAVYNSEASDGIVDVNFLNNSKNQLAFFNGPSNLYRVEIDKGTDATYELILEATDTDYFKLLGYANQGHPQVAQLTTNTNALGLLRGTVRIKNNVNIPVLNNTGNYNISEAARLWVDGGYVAKTNGTAIVPYGTIQVSAGILDALVPSGITTRGKALVKVEGGILNMNQLRTSVYGMENIGGYVQSGGITNVLGGSTSTSYYCFNLTYPGNVFNMSGGTLHIHQANSRGGVFIASDPANQNVTGGNVVFNIANSHDFVITSKAPFYNLELNKSTSNSAVFKLDGGQSGSGGSLFSLGGQDLKVLNDFRIRGKESDINYPNIDFYAVTGSSNVNDVYIGGSFNIEAGAQYWTAADGDRSRNYNGANRQPTIVNTTYFNQTIGTSAIDTLYWGNTGDQFNYDGNGTSDDDENMLELGNFVLNRNTGNTLRMVSPGPGSGLRGNSSLTVDVNGDASVLSGAFDQGRLTMRIWGSITNFDRFGTFFSDGDYPVVGGTPNAAQIRFREDPPIVINTSDNAVFGNIRFNVNTSTTVELNSDVHIERMQFLRGVIYSKNHLLKVDYLWDIADNIFEDIDNSSLLKVGDSGITGDNLIYTDGKASDGGLAIKVVQNSLNENRGRRRNNLSPITFPIGYTTDGGTTVYFRPAQVNVAGFNDDGYVRIRPVSGELQTSNLTGGEILQQYWKVSYSDFTTVPSQMAYRFYYRNQTGVGVVDLPTGASNEVDYVPGFVLDGGSYTRNYESSPSEDVNDIYNSPFEANTRLLVFNGTSSAGEFENGTYNGFEGVDASYTAGVSTRFEGTPDVYYSRLSSFNWYGRYWEDGDNWSTVPHDGASNNTARPPAGTWPKVGDIAVIGYGGGTDATLTHHSITIRNNKNIEVAEIKFENPNNNSSRLVLTRNASIKFGLMGGTGGMFMQRLNAGDTPTIDGDFGEFYNKNNFTYAYFLNSNGTYNITPAASVFPNLRVEGGNSNRIAIFHEDIQVNNTLTVDGNTTLRTSNGANGDIRVLGELRVGGYLGGNFQFNNGAERSVEVGGIRFQGSGTSNITVRNNAKNGITHRLKVNGNIIQNRPGVFNLFNGNGATDNNATLELAGDGDHNYSKTSGSDASFYRLVVNKGTSTVSSFTFSPNFNLNGATSGAGIKKALELQNGMLILDNANLNLNLTTGNDDFFIPQTAGLEVRQGVVKANGNSGVLLDGQLTVSGGTVDMSGGNNYIQYSASGNAGINVSAGNLIVGSQIRRGLTSTEGILDYTQTGGTVIVGNDAAPESNRGVFEVLNAGSNFTFTGGELQIVRAQNNPAFASVYLTPESLNTSDVAVLRIGNDNTPANQKIGIYSNTNITNLLISNSSGNNPTLQQWTVPLTVSNLLEVEAGTTLDANGNDIILEGDFVSNGSFLAKGNTTFVSGLGDQEFTGELTFYNLTKSSPGKLSFNNSIQIQNELRHETGLLVDNGNTVSVDGSLYMYGNHQWGGSGRGVVLSGLNQQMLYGSGSFGKLTTNNPEGIRVNDGNTVYINQALQMEQGVFNVGSNLLVLAKEALIIEENPFSATNMIQTNISFTDNGVKKFLPSGAGSFTFPVGSAGKYTPVKLAISANSNGTGSFLVKPAGEYHPSVLDKDNVLNYHWVVRANGLSGFAAEARMKYDIGDVKGNIADYITARLLTDGSGDWNKFSGEDVIDESNRELVFSFSTTDDAGISGDYTAGVDAAIPDKVPTYITTSNGFWNNAAIWDTYPVEGGSVPEGGPRGSMVIINHAVEMQLNYTSSYRTTIAENGLLAIGATFGHRLGEVFGSGILSLESGDMPAGFYEEFLKESGGTLRFGGSTDYDILSTIHQLNNLELIGSGERRFPNINVQLTGALRIDGPVVKNEQNKAISVKGNVLFESGSFIAGNGASSVFVLNGLATQTLSGSTGFNGANSFNRLTINNSSGVVFGLNADVKDKLTLSGGRVIVSGMAQFRVDNYDANAIVGESSTRYIDGPLYKKINSGASFEFPLGNGSRYGKVKVGNVSVGGMWRAQYHNSSPDGAGLATNNMEDPVKYVSSNEYWNIEAPAPATAELTLRWDASSGVNPAEAGLRGVQWLTDKWYEVALNNISGSSTSGTAKTGSVLNFNANAKGNYITFGTISIPAYTWTGATSTDWFTASNWTNNTVPSASANTTISSVTNMPEIGGTQVAYVNNLTITPTSSLTLNPGAKLTVNGNLTTNDKLTVKNTPLKPSSLITYGTVSGETNYEWSIPKSLEWYMSHPVRGVTEQEYEASY